MVFHLIFWYLLRGAAIGTYLVSALALLFQMGINMVILELNLAAIALVGAPEFEL